MERNKVYHGHNLDIMKSFPDESIDCIITSPPYYGLRDYGEDCSAIWGGDENCKHEWSEIIKPATHGEGFGNNKKMASLNESTKSNFCIHCNAWKGQLGLEPTFQLYIEHLMMIFDECYRILKKTGTCWVNIGDSYNSHSTGNGNVGGIEGKRKNKDDNKSNIHKDFRQIADKCLLQIPSRFAIAMTVHKWILRNEIIWYKRNCMPSSANDRFTVDFEKIFFFTKSRKYYFEQLFENYHSNESRWGGEIYNGADKGKNRIESAGLDRKRNLFENPLGRNKRCVWDITTKGYKEAHFATFPEDLVKPMIQAGCPKDGVVLDPFGGSGTVGIVAKSMGRDYILIDIVKKYIGLIDKRFENKFGIFK